MSKKSAPAAWTLAGSIFRKLDIKYGQGMPDPDGWREAKDFHRADWSYGDDWPIIRDATSKQVKTAMRSMVRSGIVEKQDKVTVTNRRVREGGAVVLKKREHRYTVYLRLVAMPEIDKAQEDARAKQSRASASVTRAFNKMLGGSV